MLGKVALLTFWLAATSLPGLCCGGYYYYCFSLGFFISYDRKLFLRVFWFCFKFCMLVIGPPACTPAPLCWWLSEVTDYDCLFAGSLYRFFSPLLLIMSFVIGFMLLYCICYLASQASANALLKPCRPIMTTLRLSSDCIFIAFISKESTPAPHPWWNWSSVNGPEGPCFSSRPLLALLFLKFRFCFLPDGVAKLPPAYEFRYSTWAPQISWQACSVLILSKIPSQPKMT